MNILIDVGHPAHIHVTKHFAHEIEKKGHQVLYTCRQKEFVIQLLEKEGFYYVSFGPKYTSTFKKLWGMVKFDWKMLLTSLKFKPDVYISLGSMYAAQVSSLFRKPHICFEDTYNMEQVMLYKPFTDLIITGNYEHPVMSESKEFRMAGYNELAYLHPNRFTADESVLDELDIKKGEKYAFVRFVELNASHDIGYHVMTIGDKIQIILSLSKICKVFISSEKEMPDELKPYILKTHPSRIHDVIAFASLVFSESATMAEEAAMLGVPALYLNEHRTYYTDHLENDYQLVHNYSNPHDELNEAIDKSVSILRNDSIGEEWKKRRHLMLKEKVDVTAFLSWLIENYPESKRIIKENPDYQYNFR